MAVTAFVLGTLALAGTTMATWRIRRPVLLAFPVMMTSWLVGELALFHLVAQMVAAGLLVAGGAGGAALGRIGVAAFVVSWVGLVAAHLRSRGVAAEMEADLRAALGDGYRDRVAATRPAALAPIAAASAWRPFSFPLDGVEVRRDVAYAEGGRRHLLDVYSAGDQMAGRPIVVYLHGGAWTIGNKDQQGKPLLLHLARCGFVGIAANYRLAPVDRWPAQIVDVERIVAFVRAHATEWGGDPAFIALVGSSAGGHLAALGALAAGDTAWRPGFVDADTSVQACVSIYAPLDLTDRYGVRRRAALTRFLEHRVMTTRLADDPDGWSLASPIARAGATTPPMYVVQAADDVLVWREETRLAVTAMRAAGGGPIAYSEVAGAQHAFEVFHSLRSHAAVAAITRFLAWVHARHLAGGTSAR